MKLSLLDQVQIGIGRDSATAVADTIALSRHLDALGFARHWIVEHHAVPYEACVDPIVLAPALAAATSQIRIGIGGVLLNNYSPYKVAESVQTLAALYPNRFDLGLGQSASGPLPDLALQPDRSRALLHDQGEKIDELLGHLFADLPVEHAFSRLKVMPDVAPVLPWIMAVSPGSAARAGALGLPLALSAFHKPEFAVESAASYRRAFKPSSRKGLPQSPQIFLAIRLSTGTDQLEAERLAMPMRWCFDQRRRLDAMPDCLPSVDEAVALAGGVWPAEAGDWPMYTICPLNQLRQRLHTMAQAVGCDEIMLQDVLPDPAMRLEHYTAIAQALAD